MYDTGFQFVVKVLMSVLRVVPDTSAQACCETYDLNVSLGRHFGLDELIVLTMFLEQLDKSVLFLLCPVEIWMSFLEHFVQVCFWVVLVSLD